jgi:Flp pilus assembly protein TadG
MRSSQAPRPLNAARGPGPRQGRRRGPRGALDACRARGWDRGASAIELAFLGPALIVLTLFIIQFALWFDAWHAALAAAREGDLVAREDAFVDPGGWSIQAKGAAISYFHGMDTGVLTQLRAETSKAGSIVSVTVSGTVTGPFHLSVSQTVTGPVECFRTQASQGAACG